MYFQYGQTETEYLKSKDRRLGAVIDALGHIDRPVDGDVFSSVIRGIVGQQISTKAQKTVWKRMQDALGAVTPKTVAAADAASLQALGMTFKKADYIKDAAQKVLIGELDLAALETMTDAQAVRALSELRGIGEWTAEMVLLFGMHRPDILSFGDLAILRGMRMVYGKREIDRQQFERYRRRFSPYGSTAAIYFWAAAAGAIPELADPAAKKNASK